MIRHLSNDGGMEKIAESTVLRLSARAIVAICSVPMVAVLAWGANTLVALRDSNIALTAKVELLSLQFKDMASRRYDVGDAIRDFAKRDQFHDEVVRRLQRVDQQLDRLENLWGLGLGKLPPKRQ